MRKGTKGADKHPGRGHKRTWICGVCGRRFPGQKHRALKHMLGVHGVANPTPILVDGDDRGRLFPVEVANAQV